MDGLLLIDKPVGPTSHDIVARVRRVLGERAVGHTGTLDPLASGLLPLVLGRATRLARFLSASDKSYEAEIRLGVATDTYDAQGTPTMAVGGGALPTSADVDRALDAFRGTFPQQPPAYSAKKIDGRRSYALARRARAQPAGPAAAAPPALPAPVTVTAHAIDVLACDGDTVRLSVRCSAGFYVRSMAHDLGQRLGIGAHLSTLRRIRSGTLSVETAVTMDALDRAVAAGAPPVIPLSGMLTDMIAVVLTPDEVRRALHGCDVGPAERLMGFGTWDLGFARDSGAARDSGGVRDSGDVRDSRVESQIPSPESHPFVRLLDQAGDLIGVAEPVGASGLLHPSIVLR